MIKELGVMVRDNGPWNPMQPYNLRYNSATKVASLVLLQDMKWAIFEKRSTTTKMESLFLWVRGNPNAKSMLTSTQGEVGTGKGV